MEAEEKEKEDDERGLRTGKPPVDKMFEGATGGKFPFVCRIFSL